MKVLLITLVFPKRLEFGNMYSDLALEFANNGHEVYVMAPAEEGSTEVIQDYGITLLKVSTGKLLGVKSLIKKGINLIKMPYQYKNAYNKYLKNIAFDWIFMPTPPITLIDFVLHVKKKMNSKFYLILRDIHPQSIWSIGLLKNRLMYKYLNQKAIKAYLNADLIGCMSPQNIDFVKKICPEISSKSLVLLYNWLKDNGNSVSDRYIRKKYNLQNKFVVLFGGNIGYGQRIDNIILLAELVNDNKDIVFLIVGKGTEKDRLVQLKEAKKLENIVVLDFLPREDYLKIVECADVGMVNINENYRVPTCPSKAISYMALKIPIFAMINPNNDYGDIIENQAKCGYYCIGGDKIAMKEKLLLLYSSSDLRKNMGLAGYEFYHKHLTPVVAYTDIINQIREYEA